MARAVVVVGVAAAGVVLILVVGFVGMLNWVNRVEPARVAVVVPTGELMVVRTGVGGRPRSFLVPAQTGVLLPPGEHGMIAILNEGCHLVYTVVQGGPATWQLVTVAPGGVTVTLSKPDATLPPFPEAEPTTICGP